MRVAARAALARGVDELAQRELDRDLQAEGQRGALVHERGDGHRPAVALPADDVLVRDPGVLHEELVELGLAGDLAQRAHLDGVLLHVHEEVAEPLVLGRVGVGARHEHAPLGVVGQRRPHLLPGDEPVVAVAHRARLDRGEVRARAGLGEALAPDLLGREDRLQVAALLLVAAVGDDRRAAHGQAQDVGGARRLGADELLVVDRLLDQRRAAPAVLGRPRHAGPAPVVQLALPGAAEGEARVVALGLAPGVVGVEPRAQLVAEGLL